VRATAKAISAWDELKDPVIALIIDIFLLYTRFSAPVFLAALPTGP